MGARTIPDGAAVTNHFSVSFAPWIVEAGATSVTGLGDEVEVIDGPDNRGYSTGRPSRRDLTVVIPDHDPAISGFMEWKEAVENGGENHFVTGTVSVLDSADNAVMTWELEHCMCKMAEHNDMSLDSAEVGQTTFTISYFRAKKIGP